MNWRTDSLGKNGLEWISAYSVAELGVMLPFRFIYEENESVITTTQYVPNDYLKAWICGIFWTAKPDIKYTSARKYKTGANEAEARAAMLIHLLENNLVKSEDCNQKLSRG